MSDKTTYTHGHHKSVVGTHARRTAQDSAAFLLPHIKSDSRILDLGCGPGSITIGLARAAHQGHVIGGDASEDIVKQAKSSAQEQKISNIDFKQIDGYSIPFDDGHFDVVFAHQTLQHVSDPVKMLKEMKRVTKTGGLVAARDADSGAFAWWPELPGLQDWMDIWNQSSEANGSQVSAGRRLRGWARAAGFAQVDIEFSWSTWNYSDDEGKNYGRDWIQRALQSGYATTAKKHNLATQEKLQEVSDAWKEWCDIEGALLIIPNGEILCHVR